jgi:hypothetical protein
LGNSRTVNEQSTYTVPVRFRDERGSSVTPSAAWYAIKCLTSRAVVKAETQLSNPESEMEIVISAEENRIVNPANGIEERVMVIRYQYETGAGLAQQVLEHHYRVANVQNQANVESYDGRSMAEKTLASLKQTFYLLSTKGYSSVTSEGQSWTKERLPDLILAIREAERWLSQERMARRLEKGQDPIRKVLFRRGR